MALLDASQAVRLRGAGLGVGSCLLQVHHHFSGDLWQKMIFEYKQQIKELREKTKTSSPGPRLLGLNLPESQPITSACLPQVTYVLSGAAKLLGGPAWRFAPSLQQRLPAAASVLPTMREQIS